MKFIKLAPSIFILVFVCLFGNIVSAATIERTYTIPTSDNQVPIGGSKLFWVQVSGIDSNAVITNVETKFDYIAYGVVQNYVSSRFNRGSDPGSSGGQVLVSQGSLPAGNPGTSGYKSFPTNWDGLGVNSNYYFRFSLASSSPYTCTIKKLYVRITYSIPWIDVTYPNGGETLTKEQNYTINWTSSNVSGNVLIHLYKGSSYYSTIAASTSNDGSYYPFNPSDSLPDDSDYQICMSAMSGTISDCSGNFTIQSPPKPDLVVQNQSASPTTVEAGSSTYISCTVKNQGSGSAASSYIKYYLSSNTTYDTSDIYFTSDYVSDLSSGGTSSENATVTIPSGTSTGTKYILFYADKDDSVSESIETNNVAYKAITVIDPVNPQVNVSPTTGPQGTTFTETGSGFTKNNTATLYFDRPGLGVTTLPVNTDSNGAYTNLWLCDDCPIGTYSYWAVDDTTNKTSNTVSFTVYAVNPQVSVSPSTGPQGTTFQQPGTGFTQNNTATLHFTCPDGSSTAYENTDGNGHYEHSWLCDQCPVGNYSYYAVDDTTGTASNTVNFTVYALNPQVSVTPSSAPQGTTFKQPGTGFTPNGSVTLHFNGPDGSSTLAKTADNNGAYTSSWLCDACPAGTYTYYAVDNTTDQQSNTVSFTVTSQIFGTPFLTPLYRSYSTTDTDHFYTTNPVERDYAANNSGYTFEKVEAYISNRPYTDGVTLHRLYNSTAKSHYYTTSDTERDTVLLDPNWVYENAAGYVYPNYVENTVPVYHLYSSSDDDHFYTISEFERDYATSTHGYVDQGIAFYAAQNTSCSPLAGKPVARQGGVDLSSGNFVPYRNHVDFANPSGFGMPFVFARTYNSANVGQSGPLGPGWNHNYQIRITDLGSILFVKWGNDKVDLYTFNGTSYDPAPGVYNKLTKGMASYIITTKNKTVYTFEEYVEGGVSYGKPVQIKDRNGITMVLMYDPVKKGALDHITDGSNRTYRFHYQVKSTLSSSNEYRLTQITEEDAGALNRSISFGYDSTGRLSSFTDAETNTTTYAYEISDNPGVLTKITLPKLSTITASYDPTDERISELQIGTSKTVQLTYDTLIGNTGDPVYGTVYKVLSASGPDKIISASHDQSKLGIIKDGLGNMAEVLAYDANNNPTQINDKNGRLWSFDYHPTTGNIRSVVNPENEVTSYEYDSIELNNLIKITDPATNVTRFEYNAKGNVWKIIRVVDGTDRTTTIDRYTNGQVHIITSPPNGSDNISATTTYTYDTNGYLASVADHLGNTSTFTYDPGGRLLARQDADLVDVDYTYDNLNHVKTVKDMLNRTTSYDYDVNGNLDIVTDPRNIITDYNYNDRDLVETVTSANVRIAKYDYDETGRTTEITNARDRSWQMSFDEAGNLQTSTTPMGYVDNFNEYYPDGNLKRQTDRNSLETSYTYDGVSRMTSLNITGGNQYGNQYWDNGQLKNISRNSTQIGSFQYDARGKLTSYTDPNSQIVSYSYYPGGNLKTITYPGSKLVTYDYDTRNLLTSVKDWKDRTTSYEYTNGGRLKKIAYPNGAYIEYLYDSYFRLKTVSNKKADGTVITEYTVDVFDELYAPEQVTTTGGIAALAVAMNDGYSYDNNNRISTGGAASFTHNDMGEILTRTANGSTDSFSWNQLDVPGRLQNMTLNGSTRVYDYDSLGNRVAATVDGSETRYVLDVSGRLANVIAETDSSGNVIAYYVHGLGLIWKILPDAAGTAHYYHYDRRGNTVALTDGSGNVTDQYSYGSDPFGFAIVRQGSTDNPFTFVGRYGVMDEGDDIFYMRARYYDAAAGRFLNEDPIGFAGGDEFIWVCWWKSYCRG